ncbi:hypothetical protein MMC10_002877 [Thelotrema lepadinum]|nr:hypothetical protein [Thelotrema lepadinum]
MAEQIEPEKQKLIIIWQERPAEKTLKRLTQNHPSLEIVFYYGASIATDIPAHIIQDTTFLVTYHHLPNPRDAPSLKLVQFISSGTEHVLHHPIYTETSIPLTNSAGVHGCQIAEWVVMAVLMHSHHFPDLGKWQREHKWGSSGEIKQVKDLCGQRLGVLGYGSIGRQVARVCQALGMNVIAYTANPRLTPESRIDRGFAMQGTGDPDGSIPDAWYSGLNKQSLHEFLGQDIDFLVVSLPLTQDTTRLLGEEEFAILGRNRNAFISNVSRGEIFDQDALVAAVKKSPEEGGLRGVALDVTDPEPLPANSELWDLPNVLITPHVSGRSLAYNERVFQILDENLTRLESKDDLINVIGRDRRASGFFGNSLSGYSKS